MVTGGLSVALDVSDRARASASTRAAAADLDAVTEATRALARSVDPAAARIAVCDGAREVAEAPVAALFEPAAAGTVLVPEASSGADLDGLELPLDGESGAALAFNRAEEVFVSLGDGAVGGRPRVHAPRASAGGALAPGDPRPGGDRGARGRLARGDRRRLAAALGDDRPARRRGGGRDRARRPARPARAPGAHRRPHRASQPPPLGTALPARARAGLARRARRSAWRCSTSTTSRTTTTAAATRPATGCSRDAAVAWRTALRPYDILARYGGEEFSVILPGCDLADAVSLVERLRAVTPAGESCSAGIAEWDGEEHPDALVGRADAALYEAKRAGRDRSLVASAARPSAA